jgi:hypothetical protein
MEAEIKPLRLRIVSGSVAQVEKQLNHLLDHYTMTQQAFAVVNNQLVMTVILLHESVLRMQAIAAAGAQRVI